MLQALVLALGFLLSTPKAISKNYNLDLDHVPDQLIIKLKANLTDSEKQNFQEEYGIKYLNSLGSGQVHLIRTPTGSDKELLVNFAEALSRRSEVEYVEANTILRALKIPDDPMMSELYGLHNDGQTGGSNDADIDAPEAWKRSTGSKSTLVAIIDTGVDYNHEDLAENYWVNPGETGKDSQGRDRRSNGIDDDKNGYIDDWRGWDFVNNDNDPMDDNGHGTHCAGTIGARGDNNKGIVGVNWNSSLVGIKFLDKRGSGTLANAILAIDYATTIGSDLTNNSWGGGGFSNAMSESIHRANEKEILFVAAAGNSTSDNDLAPHFPSSYEIPNVIAVASTDHNDELSGFSSYGFNSVDLAAPGTEILSTMPGNSYEKLSGTSMATPHVSGAIALVKSVFPNLPYQKVKSRVLSSVDPLRSLSAKTLSSGRLNLKSALEIDKIPPSKVDFIETRNRESTQLDLRWAKAGDDDKNGRAKFYEIAYSLEPIISEEDWDEANKINYIVLEENGDHIVARLSNLPFNFSGYISIKAIDNVGNKGPASDPHEFSVTPVKAILENNAESMEEVQAENPWGLEEIEMGHMTFSDSPGTDYANEASTSLYLNPLFISSADIALVLKHSYDIESRFDFGYVEISKDNGNTWLEVSAYSGTKPLHTSIISLKKHLSGNEQSILLRFRLESDYSIAKDGWKIDHIKLMGPTE